MLDILYPLHTYLELHSALHVYCLEKKVDKMQKVFYTHIYINIRDEVWIICLTSKDTERIQVESSSLISFIRCILAKTLGQFQEKFLIVEIFNSTTMGKGMATIKNREG